jgi:hypothetical protein
MRVNIAFNLADTKPDGVFRQARKRAVRRRSRRVQAAAIDFPGAFCYSGPLRP